MMKRELLADDLLRPAVTVVDPRESDPTPLEQLRQTLVVVDSIDRLPAGWQERMREVACLERAGRSDAELGLAVRYAMMRAQYEGLREDWKLAGERLRELELLRRRVTPFDPRTGWHSHAHIVDRCQEEIARALRYGLPISLVVVDILAQGDAPEPIDEDLGNSMVTALAGRIRPICRHGDILGHYGPTSVLVILLNTDQEGGERFLQRVQQSLLPPLVVEDVAYSLSWSIAVASRDPGVFTTPTDLLNQLERRVERARMQGNRGVVLTDEPLAG